MTAYKQKQCRTCLTNYPATKAFFYGNRNMTDGFHGDCKECTNFKEKSYPSKNKRVTQVESYGSTWMNGNDEIYA